MNHRLTILPGEGVESPVAQQSLLDLPFDQYQRYRLLADLCSARQRGGMKTKVLDVGGRTGLLRRFLPDCHVDIVDVAPSEEEGLVVGSGDHLPFAEDTYDIVTAADTLEHVPVHAREAFVRECCRVSRGWVVLAGPYQHPAVQEAEEVLQGFLRKKLNREHHYLNEHRELGLPDLEETQSWCLAAGAKSTHTVGHGSLDRWVGLLSLELYLDEEPGLRELAKRFYRLYSTLLYPTDRYGVVYRHALVASLDGSEPPTPDVLFQDQHLNEKAEASLASAITQLAGFDRERDLFKRERTRLEEEVLRARQDLKGHTDSICELEDYVSDLQDNAAELEELYQAADVERNGLMGKISDLELDLHAANQVAAETNQKLYEATKVHRALKRVLKWIKLPFGGGRK